MATPTSETEHLRDFHLVELRRYVVKPGKRPAFVSRFETYFLESQEQVGAILFGTFLGRANPESFTWLRGFRNTQERGIGDSAFYFGPVWRQHRGKMNDLLVDNDNVLQLTPVRVGSEIPVLPAVDPVSEPDGAHGVIVAEIFPG